MARKASNLAVAKAIMSHPGILLAKPSLNLFLIRYMRKFTVIDAEGRLVLHSHLPPLNSRAYARFISEHLIRKSNGPSHAQIGVTNACPQNCEYCYNKGRSGKVMDTETIRAVIRELKSMGVFWIGLTGGEPLLNGDLERIVESIGEDCSAKLFTTGCTLTPLRALDLMRAGLDFVSVSLDHWNEEIHDRVRGFRGAFRTALRAIEMFMNAGGMHVSVSAVLSGDMLKTDNVEEFLAFLRRLDVHEAWLSEAKPGVNAHRTGEQVISERERLDLIALQDRYNKEGGMTVNYLGHFEDREHFGCTAGHKMVYVDPFGELSPCVFIPMTFGNVLEKPLRDIYAGMRSRFPVEDRCFMNTNHGTIGGRYRGKIPLSAEDSLSVMDEVRFGPPARFFCLQDR